MNKIDELLENLRIVSTMVDENHIRIILGNLQKVEDIEGDVVEFGCNVGTTSIFLQGFLEGKKNFHVYDSFEGFPEKDPKDEGEEYHFKFEKGGCATTIETFENTFAEFDMPLPYIHKGWFKDITDLPEKISFAFFDSDFYTSILDSWEKVYPRLSKGAIVCVHDYNWNVLPGAKIACDEFLSDKPEKDTIVFDNYIGIFTKL
jgi:O-methyltransferase